MKLSYTIISILILILAIATLIILINRDVFEYIQTLGITISINLISSIIIIFLIDFKKEKDAQKELEEKRKIIYKQLITPLRNFDELILNMYKSTSSYDEMNELNYDIENINKIIEKVKLIELTKESYIGNMTSTQKWQETIPKQLLMFVENIYNFYGNNSYILTNTLSDNINNISDLKSNTHIFNLILQPNVKIEMADLLKIFDFKMLLTSTFNIKEEISSYYDENPFKINKSRFLQIDMTPNFKSGLKDEK